MQSPTALKAGDANNVVAEGEGFKYPAYAMAPVGIGPYKLDKYDEANKTVTLVANDQLLRRQAEDRQDRLQDHPRREPPAGRSCRPARSTATTCPNPVDWKGLKDDGNQVEVRPAFNILYMGLNPDEEPRAEGPQGAAGALPRAQP